MPQYFLELPNSKVIVKPVPAYSEKSAAGGYYRGPSLDGKRPGIFYANLYDIGATQTFGMPALSFHEAVPGHHLQIALNQENTNQTLWNKFGYTTSAFTEGWALYAESLGGELGLYQDPVQYFGMLSMEMHRAIRLVVDTGIHGKGWTREQAIQYSLDHEAESEAAIISEIERYMATPGQALSYKIGQLKIQELRSKATRILGDKFNIKEFDNLITYLIIAILIGGRIGYVLFYNSGYYLSNPLDIIKIWEGGMSFHGALIGIIFVTYLFSIKRNIPPFFLLDIIVCVAPIGIFFSSMLFSFAD